MSQHAILASQTLGDLYEAIPCTSNNIPVDIPTDGQNAMEVDGDNAGQPSRHRGAVICIEGIAYGDGENEDDYSESVNLAHSLHRPTDRTSVSY